MGDADVSDSRTYWVLLTLSTLPYAAFCGAPLIFLIAVTLNDRLQVPLVFAALIAALAVWAGAVVFRAGLQGAFEREKR